MAKEKAPKRKKARQLTFDGFDNAASRLGLRADNSLSQGEFDFNLITRDRIQLEAAYRGSWVTGQVIDIWAEDMTKAGIDISTNEQAEVIPKIQKALIKRGVHSAFCEMIKWGRLYGGALAVYQIEGQDLATPLRIKSVGKGQFKGFAVYDRWQLNPDLTSVIPSGPQIGLPEFYQIVTTPMNSISSGATEPQTGVDQSMGIVRVHHSRVIRNIGIQLPFWQAITEMMWGESVLERLWDQLISYTSATMSSANLIERANNRHVGIEGLREIISAGGQQMQGLEKMFDMMRTFQTNEGLTLLDKNDEFNTTSYSFSGLDSLLLQFGQQLGGATNIPLVRFFGQSPAGLNATGEADLRTYYDNINSHQNTKLRDVWNKCLAIVWQSELGIPAPLDLDFDFVSLWQMSTKDKADVSKINTETILAAEEKGMMKKSTAMKELRTMSGNVGLFANITDEEIDEADEMDDLLPKPGEVIPIEGTPGLNTAPDNQIPPKPGEEENPGEKTKDSKPTSMQKIRSWLKKR